MQRIGRVNRIGSVAGQIVNYMFYPSREGDDEINLYNNALIKLQGFHSALGEDAQIYSREEIVKEFKLYNPEIKDKTDRQLELLREVRNLYNSDRQLYEKIKNLPLKSRALRKAKKFLRICNDIFGDKELKRKILILTNYVDAGKYAQLTKKINTFAAQYQNDKQKMVSVQYEIETKIEDVWKRYKDNDSDAEDDSFDDAEPMVVVSESFV